MASDTEGIAALFSMYNDDEEEEDADEPRPPSSPPPAAAGTSSPASPRTGGESSDPNPNPNPSPAPPSPPLPEEPTGRKTLASPHPSPGLPPRPSRRSSSPFAVSSPSPLRPPVAAPPADLPRPPLRGALAIVDYAHDELAMSPEQEDGEIVSGICRLGLDAQVAEGNLEERTLSGTVHILTPNMRSEMSQHSDTPEQNQAGTDVAMDVTGTETEDAQVEEAADVSTNVHSDDPVSRFLPPPVTTKCSATLQQKINKFLAYRRAGKSFNAEVRNRKDYKNPDFLQHAVRYQEIDQMGTCFSKDVFDPYGYDKSDYYDEIEADMKRELERKEQEKKRNSKVDFITGAVQPPISASILKISAAVSAAAAAGVPMVSVSAEGVQKEARPNKKSKWDKVDGDIKNPAAPSGHDNLSAAGVSAALLTSANVGAGYAAFAQQKRKEAEDKSLRSALQEHGAVRCSAARSAVTLNLPFPPPMEFRFRAGDRRPRRPSSAGSDSPTARFPHSRGGYFRPQGMRAGPFRGCSPPPFEWEAAARRERIIREEVERRLIEAEVRREMERERVLALARGLHGGFGPDPFFVSGRFMPPPPMPMPMHPPPHAPPPRPFEEFGAWQGFGQFGPRRHAGFGQRMLLLGEERRWSPPPPKPKHKLELREIEPCESSEVLPSETKVSGIKRKTDAIAATSEPRKVHKTAQDWSCALCQVSAISEAGLNEHLEGKKHKAKLAQSGAIKVINDDKSSTQSTTGNKDAPGPSDAPKKICIQVDGSMYEVVQKNNYMWCEHCRVRCDSNVTMAGHLRGKKHSELNKVWTSIKAVRMNTKTKEGFASTCESKVNENGSIEIPVEIKKEDRDRAIEVDENGPTENPMEIKEEGADMATAGDENFPTEIPVEMKEGTNMVAEVHENVPVETPMEIKEGTDMTTDVTQLVPKEE